MPDGAETPRDRSRPATTGEPSDGFKPAHRVIYYLDRDPRGWRYEVRRDGGVVKRGWRPSRRWAKRAARRSMRG